MNVLEVLTARGGAETPKLATPSQEDANSGEFLLTFEEELGHLCTFVAHPPQTTTTTGLGLTQDLTLGVSVTPDPSASGTNLPNAQGDAPDIGVVVDAGTMISETDVASQSTTGLIQDVAETDLAQSGTIPAQITHPAIPAAQMTDRVVAEDQSAPAVQSVNVLESTGVKTDQNGELQPLTPAQGAMPPGFAVADAAGATVRRQMPENDTPAATQRHPIPILSQTLAAQSNIPTSSGQAVAQQVDGLAAGGLEPDASMSRASRITPQDIEVAAGRTPRTHVATSGSVAAYERVTMPQVTPAVLVEQTGTIPQTSDTQDFIPIRESAMIGTSAASATARTVQTGLSAQTPAPVQQVLNQISVIEDKASAGVLEVQLDPEDLGKVRLSFITRESGLVVSVFAERPETLELLRRNSDELQLGLNDMNFEGADLEFSAKEGEADPDRDDEIEPRTETRLSEAVSSKHVIAALADDRLDIRL